jgi:Outer membrane protein and related peptidoglycan-associated (lipo)proteins
MRKYILLTAFFAFALCFGANAQSVKHYKTNKNKKTTKKEAPIETQLPPRSSDCFFAAPLQIDVPFGPTEPLRGYGFVQEITPTANEKNIIEQEHNTIWYVLTIPYDGKLCLDITPKATSDDYDFMVYRYTNKYFCNRINGNKVSPLRCVMSANNTAVGGKTGLALKGTQTYISKASVAPYGKYIEVKADEKYIIVVDNLTDGGLGHTIVATINNDFAPLTVLPIDSLNRERTTANIVVTDEQTNKVVFEKEDVGAQKIKILPKKSYSIVLQKDGYFKYMRIISHAQAIKDSVLTARLVEIKTGSKLPINGDLYFDVDEKGNITVLPDSYPALNDILKTMQTYPHLIIEIIGRVATEGLNVKKDRETSIKRAEAIKNYLIGRGLPETNIFTRGSTIKELEKQITDQKRLREGKIIYPNCEIKILKTK